MKAAHPLIHHRQHHVLREARLSPGEIRVAATAVKGFNAKTAVIVPAVLGSMPFFWLCVVLSLLSLPEVTTVFDTEVLKGALGLSHFFPAVVLKVSLVGLVAWLAQTFIQLVALPILQVSSNATQAQLEGHVAVILDRLDEETAGGLQTLNAKLDQIIAAVDAKA